MNVCCSLTTTSKIVPDRIALVYEGTSWSYAELDRQSEVAAAWLLENGVEPGDRVALMLPNAPCFPVWYYAALRVGAIAVSVSTRLAAEEIAFIVSDCGARALIATEPAFKTCENDLPPAVQLRMAVQACGRPVDSSTWPSQAAGAALAVHHADPDDAALILYTSGTTGFPKGATLSHANVRSNVHAFNHLCDMGSADRVLLAVPLFHCFGQNALLNSVLNVGGTIVLQSRFDLAESKQLIADNEVTQLYGVPMMFSMLCDACTPEELASVKYCFSAAATLPIQTSQAWQEKFGLPIHEGYGLTETSPFATYNHRIKFEPGSIGMPIDSVEVKIVDPESGIECEPGQPGEIAIRGPNVMLGYWNRPEETANAIRDGWFHSGDIGRLDERGYLYIVDRVKDMITVGGLKVFPAEVERVLLDHPSVTEAAVVAAPDPVFGEQVVAFVVLARESDETQALRELQQYAKLHLGNYKIPRKLTALEALPRNPSGKILKTTLRQMAAKTASEADSVAANEADASIVSNLKPATLKTRLASVHPSEKLRVTTQFLCELAQETGELDELPAAEDSFVESGLDSLAMVSLSAQLQVEVGPDPELPPTLLFDYPHIGELASWLVEVLEGASSSSPSADQAKEAVSPGNRQSKDMRASIEQMSEEEALAELLKELH